MSRSLHAQPAPDFMIVVNRPVYVNYLHAVARTATFMVVGLVCLFATVALAQNEGQGVERMVVLESNTAGPAEYAIQPSPGCQNS